MSSVSEYNANSIELLTGLEGVRKRPAMYIGSTNSFGLHHLVWEIVDNAVDEALNGFGDKINVTIHKDGSITIADEGRGIPCGINKQTGIPAVELIFTTLHSGGKFSETSGYKVSGGLHGVGSSVTNALSEFCDVTVYNDGFIHHIRFENGGKTAVKLETIGKTLKHGTIITFKPDSKIFSSTDFKWDTIANHLQEEAFLLKKVHFVLNDERVKKEEEFYYENGLREYIDVLNQNKIKLADTFDFEDKSENGIQIEVALQWCKDDYDESIFSYVNNVRTRDGGTHEVGFRSGLTKAVNDYIDNNKLAKSKDKLDGTDIREGLTAIISLRISETILEFEGQTKEKLGTQEALSAVSNLVYSRFTSFLNENKNFAMTFIDKCFSSQNARIAARKAKNDARSAKKTKEAVLVSDKLTPAQGKDYKKNELFIVEGDSAGGSAKKGRFPKFQAILPLRGKPLNTYGLSIDKILKNEELSTIINTIGAGFGQSFDVDDSHYGKIIIMTDADTDGAHIQTLLLTFFYLYMRSLITHGMVYVAVPPLYRVYKTDNKDKIIQKYVWLDKELEEAKKEIGINYKINRYKGLGEMNADQLSYTTMNPEHRMLLRISIDDPLLVEKKVNILMGSNADLRKEWIADNINFNEVDTFIKEVKKNG
jgi:Type IIA topoisomerase (DNA gyrase/topo II, topoisomerase IV), B subunit